MERRIETGGKRLLKEIREIEDELRRSRKEEQERKAEERKIGTGALCRGLEGGVGFFSGR